MKENISNHNVHSIQEKFVIDAFEFIVNEAHLHPNDSLVDIANEAFEKLNLKAFWNENDIRPITIHVIEK